MSHLERSLLFFYTETPLHAGAPTSTGAIDLPLQRERITELPQVQASGVKGALRELFRSEEVERKALELSLFGNRAPSPAAPDGGDGAGGASEDGPSDNEFAGALAVTDARVLLLPLRSARGGWAWATSPLVLQRLARDTGIGAHRQWAGLKPIDGDHALVGEGCGLCLGDGDEASVVLEDACYRATRAPAKSFDTLVSWIAAAMPSGEVHAATRERVASQLIILSDEEFCHWGRHGTEVVTRVRIKPDTGTVHGGALWTEELLPSEALLWSVTMMSDCRRGKGGGRESLHAEFSSTLRARERMFLGGDRSVGRGLVALGFGEAK